jgi:predicted O-methyltransferase YrrM
MLDRFKVSAREKLQRALAEVVAAEHARTRQEQQDQHAELMAALDGLKDAVTTRIADTEYRARHDLSYAQDAQAAYESAAFVLEHMPTAKVFWESPDTLRHALGEIKGPGLALEFGVATGSTLRIIAETVAADRTVAGFDVFTGLPQTWRTGFPAGEFAQEPPDVPGATVIAGLFEDTLPAFLAQTDEAIAFMHVDCDLYSSTKTVLELTSDRLAPDSVLVFDEFFNYPGWRQHEYRAWTEFVDRTGRSFEYLAYTGNHEQVVVRLH